MEYISPNFFGYLANLISISHFALIMFNLSVVPFIIINHLLGTQWARNPVLRFSHIGILSVIGVEILFDLPCPLTWLENKFLLLAGESPYSNNGFLDYWMQKVFGTGLSESLFNGISYSIFFATVFLFFAIPPKLKRFEHKSLKPLLSKIFQSI